MDIIGNVILWSILGIIFIPLIILFIVVITSTKTHDKDFYLDTPPDRKDFLW